MFLHNQVSTIEEAYLLGFLYADGFITNKRTNQAGEDIYYSLGLTLQESDKEFLQKVLDFFNKKLQKTYVLKYHPDRKACSMLIFDVELVRRLKDLGIAPNKTYEDSSFIFENVPEILKPYFIWGLWDGDGSFAISRDNRARNLVSLINNNKSLLLAVVKYLSSNLINFSTKLKEKTPGDPYYRIRMVDNAAKIFGDWLYTRPEPAFFLKRKKEKYLLFRPVGTHANYGWKNPKTKGILCVDSGKMYITAKDCALAEFGPETSQGQINAITAVARGERQTTQNKRFRYLTEEEKETFKNANSAL